MSVFLLGLLGIFLAGLMGGLLGVGGGLIMVPVFTLLMGKPMPQAVATSLALIVPSALAGALVHWGAGRVDLRLVAAGVAFAVLGAALGAWLAGIVSPVLLRRVFAVVLLAVAVRMFFS